MDYHVQHVHSTSCNPVNKKFMDKKSIILIVASSVLALVLIVIAAVYFLASPQQQSQTATPKVYTVQPLPQPTVPIGSVISIPGSNGSSVLTRNFFSIAVKTIETAVYIKDNPSYSIIYYSNSGQFAIVLYATSSSQAELFRTQAESDFLSTLGVSQSEACELSVSEEFPSSYDPDLSNASYGLSFCPGAVPLQ